MLRGVLLLTLAAAFVPAPKRARLAPLLGRKRGRGNSKDADDAPKAPKKKKASGAAAKAAALAEEALAPKPKQAAPDRVTAKQKIQQRRGNDDKVLVVEEEETKGRERKKAQDEISPERRELLRGVAAAESAYAAAELLADAVQAENYERDASESAAIEGYFDTSRWPSAVLVGLDLTSRRGASKLAERRTRGADNAGMALCAPVDAGAGDVAIRLDHVLVAMHPTRRLPALVATICRCPETETEAWTASLQIVIKVVRG